VITLQSRALIDRYSLASRSTSVAEGERPSKGVGGSVEFHDFRPYQHGDELRYVDWNVYARTGRLYTRLYQADRTVDVHIVLDTSRSMMLGGKLRYSRFLAALVAYVALQDSQCQIHLFSGRTSRPFHGVNRVGDIWEFIEETLVDREATFTPSEALKKFALGIPAFRGAGLVLIISDLFDEASLQPALAAFRARSLDASFLHVMAEDDLSPDFGHLEVVDLETGGHLSVGPAEVESYHQSVREFLMKTRGAILQAGYRHSLLRFTEDDTEALERNALSSLIRERIFQKR
jgi:uncharacterized protein (DUF58 family)